MVLGQDRDFVLVQRATGQIGYILGAHCSTTAHGTIQRFSVREQQIVWGFLGIGWGMINSLGLAEVLFTLMDHVVGIAVIASLLVGFAVLISTINNHRPAARAFAGGLIVIVGGGALGLMLLTR